MRIRQAAGRILRTSAVRRAGRTSSSSAEIIAGAGYEEPNRTLKPRCARDVRLRR
jgi:hypothetical protein